jgi:hypothetical protein
MKNLLASFVVGCLLFAAGSAAFAQNTAFTYQGQLTASGQTVNGLYDLAFSLFNTNGTSVGGPLTNTAVGVTNGFFTVILDFGTSAFTGSNVWLEISVSTNGANSFTTLSPRQTISPAPWALTANNLNGPLPSGGLGGTYGGTIMMTNPANSFAGDGSGLSNLNAGALTTGIVPTAQMGSLTNHIDVSVTNLSNGNVLAYNGTVWTNGPIIFPNDGSGLSNLNASALATGIVPTAQMGSLTNHTDVLVSGLASGHVLTYNGAFWTNGAIGLPNNGGGLTNLNASALTTGVVPAAQVGSLTNHSDVLATNLVAGNILTYNGTFWTNGAINIPNNGSGLTNLNASALTTGVVPTAQMGSITNHTDVLVSGLASGHVLTYNGAFWTNGAISLPSNGGGLTNLNASTLTTGIVPTAQMGSITNHTDVSVGGLAPGHVLTYNGAVWTNTANSLPNNGAGLTNLNASALVTGVVPAAQVGSLTNHSDVLATNLAAGNILTYNGAVWTNGPLPSATGGPTPSNSIPVSLVYSGTNVSVNAAAGTHFRLLATNNFLLQNPTGASDAQRVTFEIIQDATGGRTMVLGNAFKVGTDLPFVNLTTNANLRDFMTCICSGTNFYVVGLIKGF